MSYANIAIELLERLQANPKGMAIKKRSGEQIANGALYEKAIALALELQRRGMSQGERALIQVPNGELLISSALAAMALGVAPVFADPRSGALTYRDCIRVASPDWNIVHPLVVAINRASTLSRYMNRHRLVIPPLPNVGDRQISLTGSRLRRLERQRRRANFPPGPASTAGGDADAAIAFTGGATAAPRGVIFSHHSLRGYLQQVARILEGAPPARCLLAQSPQQILIALWMGMGAMVAKGRSRYLARDIIRAIRRGEIDAYFGSPYIWLQMMTAEGGQMRRLPPSLKIVLLGGAPVTPSFLRRLEGWLHPDTQVTCLYGLTEAGPVCAASLVEKLAWEGEGDLAGSPLPEAQVTIENADAFGIGDVRVMCPALYTRYLGEAPRGRDEALRTGDLGKMIDRDNTGELLLMGRRKDMIIRAGVNIYPAHVEAAISAIADATGGYMARECALVGVWDEAASDERLVLCVAPAANASTVLSARYKARLLEAVGADLMPDDILVFDRLPVTGRQHKLDRRGLRTLVVDRLAQAGRRYASHAPGQDDADAG